MLQEIDSKLIAELPFAPNNIRLGFELSERWTTNKSYALSLLRGQLSLIKTARQYSTSYSQTQSVTVLHYRDFLLSECLYYCITNMQYKDTENKKLTSHAKKFWDNYSYDEVWDYILPGDEPLSFKYAGLLGSLSFYLSYLNLEEQYPSQIVESLLKLLWSLQGLEYNSSPRSRVNSLLLLLGVQPSFQSTANEIAASISKELRRNVFSIADISNINLRILLGEYDYNSLSTILSKLSQQERELNSKYIRNCLGINRPAGALILLQALAVEAYYKASNVLTSLPQSVVINPLNTFLVDPKYDKERLEIAEYLSLAYDAFKIMSYFNTIENAQALSLKAKGLCTYWLGYTNSKEISSNSPNRLSNTLLIPNSSLDSILTIEPLDVIDDNYSQLLGQSPKGEQPIVLSASSYIGSNIVFNTSREVGIAQVIIGNSAPVTFISDKNAIIGEGTAAFVAYPGASGTITYDQYLSLKNVSNPLVIQSPGVFTNSNYDTQLIENQISYYEVISLIDSVNQPLGSTSDRYRNRGLLPAFNFSIDTQKTNALNTITNSKEENTARINGLMSQISDVHLDSELKILQEWLDSVGYCNANKQL